MEFLVEFDVRPEGTPGGRDRTARQRRGGRVGGRWPARGISCGCGSRRQAHARTRPLGSTAPGTSRSSTAWWPPCPSRLDGSDFRIRRAPAPSGTRSSRRAARPRIGTRTITTFPQWRQRTTVPGARMYTTSSATWARVPQWAHAPMVVVISVPKCSNSVPAIAFPSSASMVRSSSSQVPVGPNRSVLIRPGSCPASTSASATASTKAVGPHT